MLRLGEALRTPLRVNGEVLWTRRPCRVEEGASELIFSTRLGFLVLCRANSVEAGARAIRGRRFLFRTFRLAGVWLVNTAWSIHRCHGARRSVCWVRCHGVAFAVAGTRRGDKTVKTRVMVTTGVLNILKALQKLPNCRHLRDCLLRMQFDLFYV